MKAITHIYKLKLSLFVSTFFLMANILTCCEEFVQPKSPENELVRATVFENNDAASAAILHIYSELTLQSNFAGGWTSSYTYLNGLYSDELSYYASGTVAEPFYLNNILPTHTTISSIWGSSYNLIYATNSIIEGLEQSKNITKNIKQQLTGEAKFLRAFFHFYLVNTFGDVPYITSTDYRKNSTIARMPTIDVYFLIIQDLIEAENLLSDDYLSAERIRPNKWVAKALLSRAYLYSGAWGNAEQKATEIIQNTALYSLPSVSNVFLKNSNEAILQLYPLASRKNPSEGELFFFTGSPGGAALNIDLVNSFAAADLRRINWISSVTNNTNTYYFANKYKARSSQTTSTEYSMVFRLAEQYLIRAEARTHLDKLVGDNSATSDLNTIRTRASLPNTTSTTRDGILDAIEQERRFELFTEWGHRLFDLKRTGRADVVLSAKPGWDVSDVLWPIPESELLINSNLGQQNSGY